VFAFNVHPADISVTAGVQAALNYLQATWQKWLPVVAVVAVAEMLVSTMSINKLNQILIVDNYTGEVTWSPDWGNQLGDLILPYLALFVLGIVSSWIFYAIAISGLRGRPLTAAWVAERGLMSLLNDLLVAVAAVVAIFASAVILVAVSAALGGLALLVWIAWIVGAVYLIIRLIFMGLAIFDGHGPVEAFSESWSLSEESVQRLFGWGLMGLALSLCFSLVGGIVNLPFAASGGRAIGTLLSDLVTMTGTCMLVFFMAVLYESQRARRDINHGAQPGYSAGQYGSYPTGAYPAVPGAYPPAPPYGAYPPAPGQYPPAPGQWPVAPYGAQAPGQWPPAPIPGQYPAAPAPWPPAPACRLHR
jgi:hypothetical protein